jgi:hypothetical protein
VTRNDQLLLHLAQGLSVGDAAKEDDHAACTAILIITDRSLLAQFGLTPTDAGWLRGRRWMWRNSGTEGG